MDVQKIPKRPPFPFFGTMRLTGNFILATKVTKTNGPTFEFCWHYATYNTRVPKKLKTLNFHNEKIKLQKIIYMIELKHLASFSHLVCSEIYHAISRKPLFVIKNACDKLCAFDLDP